MRTLIKHGRVIDPSTKKDGTYDLLIENGVIAKVEENIEEAADRVIDATGKFVMPGFVDLHAHLREPGFEYKETIETGARAAARGGYTTICPMPNTKPAIDSGEMVSFLMEKAEKEAIVNIVPVGAVTKGQEGRELSDMEAMAKAGAKAVSEDGKSVMDTALYYAGMEKAKELGLVVLAHCEDKSLVRGGVLNAGKKAEELGMKGITNGVEDIIAARDLLMAKEIGVKLHLCHCSTKDSVALLKMAKEMGQQVSGEVCPHHFTMSDDEITGDDANFKMNPPLRSKADVLALKEGLRDGTMEVIATDHAPHSQEEKQKSIKEAPFGIVGLETAFSLTMTELVGQGYLTPYGMVEKMSYNPARVLGIDKGSLAVGKPADLVIADPQREYVICPEEFASKGKNTPFAGKKVVGKVEMTFVAGKVAYESRMEENGNDK